MILRYLIREGLWRLSLPEVWGCDGHDRRNSMPVYAFEGLRIKRILE
jgi:hypothetical protein